MPITGTDDISLAVIDALNSGTKVKDIPAMFPISIDNAKRLSRYNNIFRKIEESSICSCIRKNKKHRIKSAAPVTIIQRGRLGRANRSIIIHQ